MLVEQYSLEAARAKLPTMEKLDEEKQKKAMFYLGIMSYIALMTEAQSELEERQIIINELLLDEIDTEGLILYHEMINKK